MMDNEKSRGMLSPYRVLDLTDEKGLLCGKVLGDLGADVIKVEKPGGDAARSIGPFYHDEPHPEKSLFWFAFNANKRGVTLDITTVDGQDIFKRLARTADFVIESFHPGHMQKLGLGYRALSKINPRLIMVSITPFGQSGPYRNYKAPDIVATALGGYMYPTGDKDRAPLRISHHSQAYLHAGAEAAVGAMIALHHRQITGKGQYIDLSIQASVVQNTFVHTSLWDMTKTITERGGVTRNIKGRQIWPCKDGFVTWYFVGGAQGVRRCPGLVQWMDSEGFADDFLKGFDWSTFETAALDPEVLNRIEEPTARFFMRHTQAELLEGAVKYHTTIFPINTARGIVESRQLAAREFWVEVEHSELNTSITYPGAFAHCSETPPQIYRRAPLIGEHNDEIFRGELGLSPEELLRLKEAKVV
ncbi:MAG: CaiB/BaiF CoA-transferase family protein [Chloroflexota bacterium]